MDNEHLKLMENNITILTIDFTLLNIDVRQLYIYGATNVHNAVEYLWFNKCL